MRATLKLIRYISVFLIVAGVMLYIFAPGSTVLILLALVTGSTVLVISVIFSYRQADTDRTRHAARMKTGTYLSAILVLAFMILIQAIVKRHNSRIDTTLNSRFSLSQKTTEVIGGLDSEISIICFYKETDSRKKAVEDLLSSYRSASGKIDFEFINPDRNPSVARRYKVEQFGITVVESSNGWEKISDLTESKLTNSIYRAISRQKIKIYFLTGHGERSIHDEDNIGFSNLAEQLAGENFSVNELSLSSGTGIPSDCNILIVAGPEQDILTFEREALSQYLEGGGRALFLIDPFTSCDNITEAVSGYGIFPENTVIVDRSGMLTSGSYLTPVVNRYGDHIITRGFKYFSFFPQARSVRKLKTESRIKVTNLCFTNENAYSETDINLVLEGKTRFDSGADEAGPLPLAAVSSVSADEVSSGSETRIAVFGDSDFASNKILELYGNRDLIMNTINWLSKRENLITIRPRDRVVQPVLLTMRQGRLVYWLSIAVLPAAVVIVGVWVMARKRRMSRNR